MAALLRPVGGDAAGDNADALIAEFGSLAAVLTASPAARRRVVGRSPMAQYLTLAQGALRDTLRPCASDGPLLGTSRTLLQYLQASLAFQREEQVLALFLDAGRHLLREELLVGGSVDRVTVYPRVVCRRALELGAAGLILVHNHPSGDRRPSESDLQLTRQLAAAAATLDLRLYDHLIIARSGWTSLYDEGVLA